jgi:hypothetical protein
MAVAGLFGWIQNTRVAAIIGNSTSLTGLISGIHLLGLTLLVGAVLVSSLRMLGIILGNSPLRDVASAPGRGIIAGLILSAGSGLLLFAPRASAAAVNGIFQIKMLTLVTAAAFHFGVYRRVVRGADTEPVRVRLTGGIGLALWVGVAVAGCAFILLE